MFESDSSNVGWMKGILTQKSLPKALAFTYFADILINFLENIKEMSIYHLFFILFSCLA